MQVVEKSDYSDYVILPYYYELSDGTVVRNFEDIALLSAAINVHLGITDIEDKDLYWNFGRVKNKCRNYVTILFNENVDKEALVYFLSILFVNGRIDKLVIFSRYQNIFYENVFIPGEYAVDILLKSDEGYRLLDYDYLYMNSTETAFHNRIYMASLESVYSKYQNCIFYIKDKNIAKKWKLTSLGDDMYTISWTVDSYMLSNYRNISQFLYSIVYSGCIEISNNKYCSYDELFESFKDLR